MNHQETIFEAPVLHEAPELAHEAYPYASQEDEFGMGSAEDETAHEFSWELQEGSHHETFESGGYGATEDEFGLGEDEWSGEGGYESQLYASQEDEFGLGEDEDEWSQESSPYASPYASTEDAADPFFGGALRKAWRAAKSVARRVAPIAKMLAPKAITALAGMIPGVGAVAGPLLGKATAALLREAAQEVASMEAAFFNPEGGLYEVGEGEQAHEAALTELLAHEASMAESVAEAESILAATLPITITIMGGRRSLRPVVPTLVQANGRLVRALARQGPAGRALLPAVPAIQRQAVATMRAAARRGTPITGALGVRALAAATGNVLGNPRRVQRIIERNGVLRARTAPPTQRRAAIYTAPPGRAATADRTRIYGR